MTLNNSNLGKILTNKIKKTKKKINKLEENKKII
jgi:hypothetical protein